MARAGRWAIGLTFRSELERTFPQLARRPRHASRLLRFSQDYRAVSQPELTMEMVDALIAQDRARFRGLLEELANLRRAGDEDGAEAWRARVVEPARAQLRELRELRAAAFPGDGGGGGLIPAA